MDDVLLYEIHSKNVYTNTQAKMSFTVKVIVVKHTIPG